MYIALTFIDYSAAFDSVSHKFIDRALAARGERDTENERNISIDLLGGKRGHGSGRTGW